MEGSRVQISIMEMESILMYEDIVSAYMVTYRSSIMNCIISNAIMWRQLENNYEQLEETIMDKTKRLVKTVKYEEIEEVQNIIKILFDKNEADARKEFILENQYLIKFDELDL